MGVIEDLKSNYVSQEVKSLVDKEGINVELFTERIIEGKIVIFRNNKRNIKQFCAVGKGLSTKVNVNIGTSPNDIDIEKELKKVRIAEKYKADAIMDLSTGGELDKIRREIINSTSLPIGTVPVYQAMIEIEQEGLKDKRNMTEKMFEVIERQLHDGVDFITVHCGVVMEILDMLKKNKRIIPAVSRGGALLLDWMRIYGEENPLYSEYDRLIKLAERYDAVLSLGDGMRPGCIADATDAVQIKELEILAELAEKALSKGVQVIIEGPGHVPINDIEKNIKLQKKMCNEKPFYVLGPIVTDIAPGYDHITGAIGGAMAAYYGADFLCYLTPAEHLRLPTVDDVKDGLIASKIAAHTADIGKGIKGVENWDSEMSRARYVRDWTKQVCLSIDPDKSQKFLSQKNMSDVCSMCGKYCSMKMVENIK